MAVILDYYCKFFDLIIFNRLFLNDKKIKFKNNQKNSKKTVDYANENHYHLFRCLGSECSLTS